MNKVEETKKVWKSMHRYFSRCKLGFCKNEDCENNRRHCSAYCQECSNKNKKNDKIKNRKRS